MKLDDAFEIERNRLAGLHALRDRMMQQDSIDALLMRATPRPAPIFNLSRPQIGAAVALALCLGLSLGVIAERTWIEANAAEVQK